MCVRIGNLCDLLIKSRDYFVSLKLIALQAHWAFATGPMKPFFPLEAVRIDLKNVVTEGQVCFSMLELKVKRLFV